MPSYDIAYSALEIERLKEFFGKDIADHLRIAKDTVTYLEKEKRKVDLQINEYRALIINVQRVDRYYASGGIHPCYD